MVVRASRRDCFVGAPRTACRMHIWIVVQTRVLLVLYAVALCVATNAGSLRVWCDNFRHDSLCLLRTAPRLHAGGRLAPGGVSSLRSATPRTTSTSLSSEPFTPPDIMGRVSSVISRDSAWRWRSHKIAAASLLSALKRFLEVRPHLLAFFARDLH
jgi:hypothetical protein